MKWLFTSNEDTNYTYPILPGNEICLAQAISVVTGENVTQVLDYISEIKHDQQLKDEILGSIANSPFRHVTDRRVDFAKRMGWYAVARITKPKVVIETGVDKGLGSVVLCSALIRNRDEGFPGRYFGTDLNPKAGFLLNERLRQVGEILYGDSIESLSSFTAPIDLFINDSDHSSEYEYAEYCTIKDRMSMSGIILGDNSHVTDELSRFSQESGLNYIFWREVPHKHWYPGGGIGFSFPRKQI
jgi:predicted O-methyltransferase YrrM